ncbi:hypothetical protein [Cupriavidus pauculus]|uniref:hypothetical protein n=1 Tax=Cupriavidus pauculus TaxID=82633 RepID=UPI001EE187AD|nr:hypothetical protein [Cupriavidus pauculus]GJG97325.1 hypothetical protein CBA19C6_22570 [Cupriavidus pauculus]
MAEGDLDAGADDFVEVVLVADERAGAELLGPRGDARIGPCADDDDARFRAEPCQPAQQVEPVQQCTAAPHAEVRDGDPRVFG